MKKKILLFLFGLLPFLPSCLFAQYKTDIPTVNQIRLTNHLKIPYSIGLTYNGTFSPDSRSIAVSLYGLNSESGVGVWGVESGDLVDSVLFGNYHSSLSRVSFSSAGDFLLMAPLMSDSIIKWEYVRSGTRESKLQSLVSFDLRAYSPFFLLTPDQKNIYMASSRFPFVEMNLATSDTLQRFEGHTGVVWSMEYNNDSTRIVTVSVDRSVRVWNAFTAAQEVLLTYSDSSFPFRATFSSDGRRLLLSTGSNLRNQSVLQEFDSYSGELIREYDKPDSVFFLTTPCYYSPDGKVIAAINEKDSSLVFWETQTGMFLGKYSVNPEGNLKWIAFSPDGTYLAAGGLAEPIIHVWKWEHIDSSVEEKVAGERQLTLHNIRPNPAQDYIQIPFTLAQSQNVSLSLVDMSGRPVGESREMMYEAGEQSASWNVENLPSGVYYVVLTIAGERQMKPVQVVR